MATPLLIGFLRDLTHSFVSGLFFLALVLIGASVLVISMKQAADQHGRMNRGSAG